MSFKKLGCIPYFRNTAYFTEFMFLSCFFQNYGLLRHSCVLGQRLKWAVIGQPPRIGRWEATNHIYVLEENKLQLKKARKKFQQTWIQRQKKKDLAIKEPLELSTNRKFDNKIHKSLSISYRNYSASSDLSHFHFPKKCWQIGWNVTNRVSGGFHEG